MGINMSGHLYTQDAWWGMQATADPELEFTHKQLPPPLEITHDPMEGFPRGRKPRVMHATHEEMVSANLHPRNRDYCAHKTIAFKDCRFRNGLLAYRCHHEKHEMEQCQYEDYIIRMKEAERERRLRERDEARARATLTA